MDEADGRAARGDGGGHLAEADATAGGEHHAEEGVGGVRVAGGAGHAAHEALVDRRLVHIHLLPVLGRWATPHKTIPSVQD